VSLPTFSPPHRSAAHAADQARRPWWGRTAWSAAIFIVA